MEAARAAQALALASSSLRENRDVSGALASLMDNCRDGLSVDAVGIVVEVDGRLEMLAASSHRPGELEVHQHHHEEGPYLDAFRTASFVEASSEGVMEERWPVFGPTMLAAGFESVHATALVWRASAFGAMGLFRRSNASFTPDEHVVAQAFADLAAMLVARADEMRPEELARRLWEALEGRVVIEHAKGVLADQRDVSMSEAYEALVRESGDAGETLTVWAANVVLDAQVPR